MSQSTEQQTGPSLATALGSVLFALVAAAGIGYAVTHLLDETVRDMLASWSSPFWVSVRVAAASTLLAGVTGLAGGYVLAKSRFPGRDLLEALGSVPIILPPTVLGYYLINVLGNTWSGRAVQHVLGGPALFHTSGIVIVGAIAGFPYVLRAARAAIMAVDPRLEQAARGMGMPEWRVALLVTLPSARRGLIVGLTLGAARAWGEYGATLMVGGNLAGRTRTMSLAVTDARSPQELHALIGMMAVVAVGAMLTLVLLERPRT